MVSQESIQEAVQRLIKAYNPLKIYLFGPYAWGTPDEEDDLNLLIVVESSGEIAPRRTHKAFEALLGLEIPHNVTVFTRQEFDGFSSDVTSSTHEIKTRGKLLYARS